MVKFYATIIALLWNDNKARMLGFAKKINAIALYLCLSYLLGQYIFLSVLDLAVLENTIENAIRFFIASMCAGNAILWLVKMIVGEKAKELSENFNEYFEELEDRASEINKNSDLSGGLSLKDKD